MTESRAEVQDELSRVAALLRAHVEADASAVVDPATQAVAEAAVRAAMGQVMVTELRAQSEPSPSDHRAVLARDLLVTVELLQGLLRARAQ